MSNVEYINGKKYYIKSMERLSNEKINGKVVVFYKDRNYGGIGAFVFNNLPSNLPKEITNEKLQDLVGLDKYGRIISKNLIIYETGSTKQEVIKNVTSSLKIKSFNGITKSNVKTILNEIIKKYGHNYPNYAYGFSNEPKSKNDKYNVYYAFLPTTSGDEPYQFKNALDDLNFDYYFPNKWDEPYHFEMKHKKTGIIVSLTEGDIYMKIPR